MRAALEAKRGELKQLFEAVAAGRGPNTHHRLSGHGGSNAGGGHAHATLADAITMKAFMELMKGRKVLCKESVQQKSSVTGDPMLKTVHHSSLEAAQAAAAFVCACKHTWVLADEYGRGMLFYNTFETALALCAADKYSSVGGMTPGAQVAALVDNVLGAADTRAAIEAATYVAPPTQFDAARDATPLGGESEDDFAHWLSMWKAVEPKLKDVRGYPLAAAGPRRAPRRVRRAASHLRSLHAAAVGARRQGRVAPRSAGVDAARQLPRTPPAHLDGARLQAAPQDV